MNPGQAKIRAGERSPLATELAVPGVPPLKGAEVPRVSIVVLNWNGLRHLEGFVTSMEALDWPADRLEIIAVDNGSDDGSQAFLRKRAPSIRLIEHSKNLGFSAGCNDGAGNAAEPGVLVFLNNDLRVEPGFLRALVAPLVAGTCVATAGRMYAWDGKSLDSAGGGMNFHGIGIQRGYGLADGVSYDEPRKTLFACGGAMAMDAGVFAELGGFDGDFFAYYEDVDLGWRTWLAGHEVHYVPGAVCYHHHSSTSRRVPPERLRRLQVRNPLLACFKNYDDENLRKMLPAMLGLATRRALLGAGPIDDNAYRIEAMTSLPKDGPWQRLVTRLRKRRPQPMARTGVADLLAINDLLGRWDHWRARRAEVQALRRRPDSAILPLFLRPMWCVEGDPGYAQLQAGMTDFLGIDELFEGLTTLHEDPRG